MEVLKEVSAGDQLRTRIRLQEKTANDWKARISYAKLEGLEEGEAIGEARGLEKGVAIGERKKQQEIARKALTILDDETTSQLTGLTLAEIAMLRLEQQRQGGK